MTVQPATLFLWGALTMASLAIALFFWRFWRLSRDRIFVGFAIAFLLLAMNWLGLAFLRPTDETRHWFYIFRLAAFLTILWSVIDKNRRPRH